MNPVKWVKDRVDERTSWDGAVLIACGLVILLAGPLAKIAAWGAIGYGAWTIWKKKTNMKLTEGLLCSDNSDDSGSYGRSHYSIPMNRSPLSTR